jgi:hypothetical protein
MNVAPGKEGTFQSTSLSTMNQGTLSCVCDTLIFYDQGHDQLLDYAYSRYA